MSNSCDPMDYSTPGLPVYHQLLGFSQTHVHWVGDSIQPSHPLLSPSPPALNLSQHQGLFKWVSFFCIRWPKYCSFSFSISPSNEYSRLISVRMDWLDFFSAQGTLKSLLPENADGAQHPLPTQPCNNWAHESIINVTESPKPISEHGALRDVANDS